MMRVIHRFRTGDHVRHKPTGEHWVVAYADYETGTGTGTIAANGWPLPTIHTGAIEDCELIEAIDDHGHGDLLAELAVAGDPRADKANSIAMETRSAAA